MKKLLLTFCVCILAAPAFGQGSAITVIHGDGSKDVVGITKKTPPPAPEPAPAAREPSLRELFEKTLQPAPQEVRPPPVRDVKAAPEPKAVKSAPKLKPKPKSKPKKPAQAATKPRQAEEGAPPIPARKPRVSTPVASVAPKPAAAAPLAAAAVRGVVAEDGALRIALNVAPPARDMRVVGRALGDDKDVYAVVFSTDKGPYEVLVDPQNGDVLSKGYVGNGSVPTLPGHLPSR